MSKRIVHIVSMSMMNSNNFLLCVSLIFSLCLTLVRLLVTSELPTAVRGRRLDFTVLYYGDTETKKTRKKSEWPSSGLKVEMVS